MINHFNKLVGVGYGADHQTHFSNSINKIKICISSKFSEPVVGLDSNIEISGCVFFSKLCLVTEKEKIFSVNYYRGFLVVLRYRILFKENFTRRSCM